MTHLGLALGAKYSTGLQVQWSPVEDSANCPQHGLRTVYCPQHSVHDVCTTVRRESLIKLDIGVIIYNNIQDTIYFHVLYTNRGYLCVSGGL